jgi:hypothetical protein
MSRKHGLLLDKAFGLLVVVVVLQAVAVGLLLRYGGDILEKNRAIEERTLTMMTEIFPTLRSDLGDVSQKASEIKDDVAGLRSQVSKVDEHLTEVNQGVNAVGAQVEGLNHNVQGFVQDKTGLIWGHSLNPYVLIALLAIIAVSVPWWGWYYFRNRPKSPAAQEEYQVGHGFSAKLDRLSRMVEEIRVGDAKCIVNPELQRLMDKAERLIDEARLELTFLAGREKCSPHEPGDPDTLH